MGLSFWHLLVVVLVVVLLFGTKRLPNVMEDLAKGIKSFKKGLKDEDHKSLAQDKKEDQKAGE
jgi:sec-independent protein translocase protein TatA